MSLPNRQGKVLHHNDLFCVCESEILYIRLVRDQANKTLDIYLQRVRKYGAILPDSVLPPTNAGDTRVSSAPRMGTAQNDTSWAGWAISSFTNKLASARGEIQPRPAVDRTISEANKGSQASISPVSNTLTASTNASTPVLDRKALNSIVPSANIMSTSTTNYFDEDPSLADEAVDAWATMDDFEEPPTAPKQPRDSIESLVPYDDSGEPDFAGWLAAQTQSKAKKPLPKGLFTKSNNSNQKKPVVTSRVITRGSIESRVVPGNSLRPAAAPTSQPTPVSKTVDTKPKDEGMGEEDDAWGAEWE